MGKTSSEWNRPLSPESQARSARHTDPGGGKRGGDQSGPVCGKVARHANPARGQGGASVTQGPGWRAARKQASGPGPRGARCSGARLQLQHLGGRGRRSASLSLNSVRLYLKKFKKAWRGGSVPRPWIQCTVPKNKQKLSERKLPETHRQTEGGPWTKARVSPALRVIRG